MVGEFYSLIPLLWWVLPPYLYSNFSLLTFFHIVVLFLFGYMLYKFLLDQQHHCNIKHRQLHILRLVCYWYYVLKKSYVPVKLLFIWSLIICYNFSCPLLFDASYCVLSMISSSLTKKTQREYLATGTDIMQFHVCYCPHNYFVK